MLHSKDDNEEHMDLPTFPEDVEDAKADIPSLPDSQAEFLQSMYQPTYTNPIRYLWSSIDNIKKPSDKWNTKKFTYTELIITLL